MSRDDKSITEVFVEIAALAERIGVAPINALLGCWEHQVDPHWWIAVNGHAEPVQCSMGTKVPSFSAYVQFNGWPAGIINPFGGTLVAADAANEDTFIAALQAANQETTNVA